MSNERYKLHPISAVISFVKGLKDLLFPIVIVLFLGGSGGEDSGFFRYIPYIFTGLALVLYLASGVIKWWKFVYWFEDGELRIEYGLFVKKKRYIPFERIQSLDYTEGIFHRPFGLVKVKVETAGGGAGSEAEAELTAIRLQAAEQIKEEMVRAKRRAVQNDSELLSEDQPVKVEPTATILHTMSTKDLLVLALTSGGIGIFFSGIAVALSQFSEFIPYEAIYAEVVDFLRFGFMLVALLVFLLLAVAFLVSVGITFLQNYQFTVSLDEKELVLKRGLLEKKRTTVPLKRIQSVQMVENPLRQLFGYVTLVVDSAGGGGEEHSDSIKLVPLMKKREARELLESIFDHLDFAPEFTRSPKRARKFYYRAGLIVLLLIGSVLSYFFFPYGLLFFLLLPITFFLGMWNHRTTGVSLYPTFAVFQYRNFARRTVWMDKKRIQSVTLSQSYFEKRSQVGTLRATVKAGSSGATHSLRALDLENARQAADWYLPNRK